jgi:hypothetical protein
MPCSAGIGGAKESRALGAFASGQARGARGAGDAPDQSARAVVPIEPLAQREGDRMPCRAGIGGAKESRALGTPASSQARGARGAGDGVDRSTRAVLPIEPLSQWEGDQMPCSTGIGGAKESRTLGAKASSQARGARGAGDGVDQSARAVVPIEPLAQWEGSSVPCGAGIGGAKESCTLGAFASSQARGARGAGDGEDAVVHIEPLAQWEGDRMPCWCLRAHKSARRQSSL